MVGPPSEHELCLETMKIRVLCFRIVEPCKAVPIGFLVSPRGWPAYERLGARTAFGFSEWPARRRLAERGAKGTMWGLSAEAVLCE